MQTGCQISAAAESGTAGVVSGRWGLSVPCVNCRMERRGAHHSEYERTQSTTQRETAGMQQHGGAYMFKEDAAESGLMR